MGVPAIGAFNASKRGPPPEATLSATSPTERRGQNFLSQLSKWRASPARIRASRGNHSRAEPLTPQPTAREASLATRPQRGMNTEISDGYALKLSEAPFAGDEKDWRKFRRPRKTSRDPARARESLGDLGEILESPYPALSFSVPLCPFRAFSLRSPSGAPPRLSFRRGRLGALGFNVSPTPNQHPGDDN